MKNLEFSENAIATPLVQKAYKLHCLIFHHCYSYPFQIHFKGSKVFVSVDSIFRLKYVPWLLTVVFIKFLIGFNSCVLVLMLKFFCRETQIDVLVIVFLLLLASLWFLEIATYTIYCLATEMTNFLNELFLLERTCKFCSKF